MKITHNEIDDLLTELYQEISDLKIIKEEKKAELTNLINEQKEIMLQINDLQKIMDSYSVKNEDTHAVFSPLNSENQKNELVEVKESQMRIFVAKYELITERVNSRTKEYEELKEAINKQIDYYGKVENIKKSINNQVNTYNNEVYIRDLKEIQQKKRLIQLEYLKYSPVVKKVENLCIEPEKNILTQMKLALSFIQTEPVRAKQILEKSYDELNHVIAATEKYMNKIATVENIKSLSNSLKEYVNDIGEIYSNIKFKMTAYNLQSVDYLDDDLNRCLMGLFRGLINCIILNNNPKEIQLKFAYEDGYLNVTGSIMGDYINFYNEMKSSPNSMIANLYEKVFLLNGDMVFRKNKDNTFSVMINVPIKNYLI